MPLHDAERAAELYRRFGPVVYARCRRLLGEAAAAEDATQETFVRVLRHIEDAPDDRAVLRWLYRIGTNVCLNMIRDGRRRPVAAGEALPDVASEGSIEASLEDRDLALKLLSSAPEKLRAPALLHWVDGLDQGKVAETLDVTRRTVINRLNEFARWARQFIAGAGGGA